MANTSAWVSGNGVGLTWTALFNTADLNSLASGSSILSGISGITNGTALDQFMDVSVECSITSSTITAGACMSFWIMPLGEDGTTYGDGSLASGTASTVTPALYPSFIIPIRSSSSMTAIDGFAGQVVIPPGTFLVATQNNLGVALSSSGNAVKYRTYNINLNR